VSKFYKKVKVEETNGLTEVSFAVLKKRGKLLAKFDGMYSGVGNATDFGLFSFLKGEAKQLFVSRRFPGAEDIGSSVCLPKFEWFTTVPSMTSAQTILG
jgi:hypothetical protein